MDNLITKWKFNCSQIQCSDIKKKIQEKLLNFGISQNWNRDVFQGVCTHNLERLLRTTELRIYPLHPPLSLSSNKMKEKTIRSNERLFWGTFLEKQDLLFKIFGSPQKYKMFCRGRCQTTNFYNQFYVENIIRYLDDIIIG